MKAPRRGFRLDKHPGIRAKAKRVLRMQFRLRYPEAEDERYPDTSRTEKLVTLHAQLKRRRARNKVARASRKANR